MPLSIIETNPSPPPSPPRLTLESLQHPSLQPSAEWPMRRLKNFIQGQKSHIGYYSRLGASYYQHWKDHIDQPVGEGNTAASGPGPSAFATPILKPRAPRPALPDPPQQEPLTKVPRSEVQPEALPERTSLQKAADDTDQANLAVSKSREALRSTTNTKDQDNNSKKHKRQITSTKVPDTTKESESKGDEHEQRLAERRERRRAKRDIVKPPPPPSSSSTSGSSVTEEARPSSPERAKKKGNTKERKGRKSKSKIIPGIYLMENFSAGNLGKERLTLKPTAAVGLFNKGRSSAHSGKDKATAVPVSSKSKKGKKAKAPPSMTDLLFSEFAFLKPSKSGDDRNKRAPLESPAKSSRTKERRQKKRIVMQEETESGESVSSCSSNVSPPQSPSKARFNPTRKISKKDKVQRPVTTATRRDSSKSKSQNKATLASKAGLPPPSDSSDASGPSRKLPSNADHPEQEADTRAPDGLRYLSPPWEVDGDLVGDLVPVSERDEAITDKVTRESPSPSAIPSEKVIVVSGKWGLTGKEVTQAVGEPQVTEVTEEITAGEDIKSTNGTRSRFFPAPQSQNQACSKLTAPTDDTILLSSRRGAVLRSPDISSHYAREIRRTCSKPLPEGNQQAYLDTLPEPIMNHAQTMYDGPYPTPHYDHSPNAVFHQKDYIPEPEHFSVSSRVASPDFDPAEDLIPDQYIISPAAGFEQGLAIGGEYPLGSHLNSVQFDESFYLTGQGHLQQTQATASAQRLWTPQGVPTEESGVDPYSNLASSTSVVPGCGGLGYTHFEVDRTDRFEEAYYDEQDNHEGGYQHALHYAEYAGQGQGGSPDDGDWHSRFDQVPVDDVENMLSEGGFPMPNDFAYLDDSIEYHHANQRGSQISYGQQLQHYPSSVAQNEIGEEGEICADEQDASPTSERVGSNFKHGRALLFGIQQVHDGGAAEVDAEFARQLWRR
ncbi:hypothetical protein FS837_012835 [Tulasnella sp. UAMH 9824]|nr:hypothetical protein FS837_012835 [Tulasnella sp. UAMH 9824]